MKIVVLLLTFGVILNFSNAAFTALEPPPLSPEPHALLLSNCSVFIHMAGGQVLKGNLEFHRNCPMPEWIFSPRLTNLAIPKVFIQGTEGRGLVADLVPHYYNGISNIAGDGGFVDLEIFGMLVANLLVDNHPLDEYRDLRLFVRMPNHHFLLHSGQLIHHNGVRPNWMY